MAKIVNSKELIEKISKGDCSDLDEIVERKMNYNEKIAIILGKTNSLSLLETVYPSLCLSALENKIELPEYKSVNSITIENNIKERGSLVALEIYVRDNGDKSLDLVTYTWYTPGRKLRYIVKIKRGKHRDFFRFAMGEDCDIATENAPELTPNLLKSVQKYLDARNRQRYAT